MQTVSYQYSAVAEPFATFVLPHLLFVKDFQDRQKSVATCWIAWNIGLISDYKERESEIDRISKLVVDDTKCHANAAAIIFKNGLRELIAYRRNLFPRIKSGITKVELQLGNEEGINLLEIQTEYSTDTIELVTDPSPETLPDTFEALAYIGKTTAQQRHQLQKPWYVQTFTDTQATRRAEAYSLQRADLIAYAAVLTVWTNKVTDPAVKESILYWLEVLNDIAEDTEAVLMMFADM